MSKKLLAVVGGLILILAVAGGSFYGGILFQQQQAANVRAAFSANRGGGGGGDGAGGGGGGGNFFGAGGGGVNGNSRRGEVGQIKSIDGNTITLSTAQSVVKVTMTDTTRIEKVVVGSNSDLQVGARVIVRGAADSSGNVTADSIQITQNSQP
jgi:hypothetical protein